MMLLTSCGIAAAPPTATKQAEAFSIEQDQSVPFQQQVVPIMEELVEKYYSGNEAEFNAQTELYFDDQDAANMHLVFLVKQKESKVFQAFRKDIEARLGLQVIFKSYIPVA
ncbi:hypothetical protein SAMN05518847_113118 [Paenibacillus sp. OV219]|nr:hypothetical protein SAMN05518847_113118 [Paenibacillus sp. OV219]